MADVVRHLRPRVPEIRWVADGNIHLTLKFLGSTPDGQEAAVIAAATSVAARFSPMTVSLKGIGAFPSPRKPRIVWAGMSGETASLASLSAGLDKVFVDLGFEPETRPFSPHVTIGRARKGESTPSLEAHLARFDKELGPAFTIEEIVLFHSDLTPAGPLYTRRGSAPLRG